MRSYTDNGEHYDGQIGVEATLAEFVDALIAATREMVRVLKPSGSIWVNLGDKYNAYNGNRGNGTIQTNEARQSLPKGAGLDVKDVRPKSLMGIPWRYALRCIDDLGLILRAEIIWSKPSGLPESVTDRVRRSHEQWFHMVKQPRYFSAVDEIREEHSMRGALMACRRRSRTPGLAETYTNPLGRLPGSVWTIPTQPLTVPPELGVDHFAAYPMEFPRRIIQGWSPARVCTACGEGRRPVTETALVGETEGASGKWHRAGSGAAGVTRGTLSSRSTAETTITGYACACPEPTAPTRPSVILDPFGGTGTTALIASALGRHGISIDMSADYSRLATWRTTDPSQLAAALQVKKPEPVAMTQESLW